MISARTACRLAAILFVLTASLLIVGVAAEADDHDEGTPAATGEAHDENAEAESGEGDDGDVAAEQHEESEEETILGVDAEAPGPIAGAVLVSLLVAAALWFRGHRAAGLAGLIVGIGLALFDVAEVVHQIDESRAGIALLAAVVATGHAIAAAASGRVAWNPV